MYVYVLEFEKGQMYVGITANISKRTAAHRNFEVKSTQKFKPHTAVLLHYWNVPSYSLASRFERYLHKQSKQVLRDIIEECPQWNLCLETEAETMPLQWHELQKDTKGKIPKNYNYGIVSLSKQQMKKD